MFGNVETEHTTPIRTTRRSMFVFVNLNPLPRELKYMRTKQAVSQKKNVADAVFSKPL